MRDKFTTGRSALSGTVVLLDSYTLSRCTKSHLSGLTSGEGGVKRRVRDRGKGERGGRKGGVRGTEFVSWTGMEGD